MALPRIEVDGPYYEITIFNGIHEPMLSQIKELECVRGEVFAFTLRTEITIFGDPDAALDQITDIILQGEE